jgi:carbonic anhydrase
MCERCQTNTQRRRDFLKLGAAGLLAVGAGGLSRSARAAEDPPKKLTPDEAIEALKSGNQDFVDDPNFCTNNLAHRREQVAPKQSPWATIISCSDSRVPPELIFGGLGLGELFVARNAGNLVDTAVLGTVEYGAAVLGSPLIVVLGHSRCGAVEAACEVVTENATFPGSIGPMIEPILAAAIAAKSQTGDFLANAVQESAHRTARRVVAASSIISGLVDDKKLKVVAAIYDLDSGAVSWLE